MGNFGAIEQLAVSIPDLMLIDHGLQEINRFALAITIREKFPHERLFRISQTGYGQPTDIEDFRKAGFDAHLKNPFVSARLDELIWMVRARKQRL